jgi:hypothetical protein
VDRTLIKKFVTQPFGFLLWQPVAVVQLLDQWRRGLALSPSWRNSRSRRKDCIRDSSLEPTTHDEFPFRGVTGCIPQSHMRSKEWGYAPATFLLTFCCQGVTTPRKICPKRTRKIATSAMPASAWPHPWRAA